MLSFCVASTQPGCPYTVYCIYPVVCRFSQFFTKPLFNREAVLREVNAVDAGEWLA